MSDCDTIFAAASQLPVADRLRLIDDLAISVPDDQPPSLSDDWLEEIKRRTSEIDSGTVETQAWTDVRRRLFKKHGFDGAN